MKLEELILRVDRIHALVHDPEIGNYSHAVALNQQINDFVWEWQGAEIRALKEAVALITEEYPRPSLDAGNWPTVKPIVDRLDAALAKAVKP